jgi:hypothetical protein
MQILIGMSALCPSHSRASSAERARRSEHCRHFTHAEKILDEPVLARLLVEIGERREC